MSAGRQAVTSTTADVPTTKSAREGEPSSLHMENSLTSCFEKWRNVPAINWPSGCAPFASGVMNATTSGSPGRGAGGGGGNDALAAMDRSMDRSRYALAILARTSGASGMESAVKGGTTVAAPA